LAASLRLQYSSSFKQQSSFQRIASLILFWLAGCSLLLATMFVVSYVALGHFTLSATILNVFVGLCLVYGVSSVLIRRLSSLPTTLPQAYIFPTVAVAVLILVAVITVLRLPYSRPALLFGAALILLLCWLEHYWFTVKENHAFAVIPVGFYQPLLALTAKSSTQLTVLQSPDDAKHISGLIVDGAASLSPEWQRLVAQSLAQGVPVLNSVATYESLLGKTPLDEYSELKFGDLSPSIFYTFAKRWLESLLIIASLPLSLPLLLLTVLLIKLESPGSAIFTQQRVGKGGKVFTLYKLRSMRNDSEAKGAQFASQDDARVTKVGKVIRKLRIDEIPQLFNVLKGDMALIGPRPEQESFVQKFEQEIPFYSYRHVVRPGITGWAQVTQGYADDDESTKVKLAYDFYYVKNISLWLDLHITLKTILTILTGFGAR